MATDEREVRETNAYFEELDGVAARLDAIAKTLTPDTGDDGTPPDAGGRTESNSYFASFKIGRASCRERV